jgi:membrane protease YdiL (CAAX protease family)
LQTLMRSLPFAIALIPSTALFASAHLFNPNVRLPAFTFVNTALAGIWLAIAYWRTRSLWLPLGLHWSWNWAMGSVLGLPVSGITALTRAPLVRAADAGPAWLTGGDYGIEGGAACTVALVAATVFIWRTKLLRADPELKRFTDGEMPKQTVTSKP